MAKAQGINSVYNSNNDLSPRHFQAINDGLELMARISAKDHQLLLVGHQSSENAQDSEQSDPFRVWHHPNFLFSSKCVALLFSLKKLILLVNQVKIIDTVFE